VGRRRYLFVVGTLFAFSLLSVDHARAQGGRHNGNGRGGQVQRFPHRGGDFHRTPSRIQQRYMQLSPEERQTFRRNAERWLRMDAQQRNELRQRERERREQSRVEAETVLRDSGLRLENGARAQFEERYYQERRRMEQALRQEAEAKRQQELPQMKERLKNEFQQQQQPVSPGVSVAPPSSPRP
jgi:hypothetical protein